ncbi:MAG: hypothetical protein AB7W16_15575 [Candidatus Obscuribacterales bacterium]
MTFEDSKENYRSFKGFEFHRNDPYGFWSVRRGGKVVDGLDSNFTQLGLAVSAVEVFIANEAKVEKKKK